MSQIRVERTIDLPSSQLWDAMKNFGDIENFHPLIKASPLLGNQAEGIGAQRRCDFYDGNWVKERVLDWQDGRSMSISIYDGSMPVKDGKAVITLHKLSPSRTKVTFDMAYVPKMGPLGKVMDALMMRSQFTKILGDLLEGLETHVRTGAVIGKGGKPQPVQQMQAAA